MLGEMSRSVIGRNISVARQQCGMSLAELAELTDTDTDGIAHLESGSAELSLDLLLKICSVTGASPNDILSGAYVTDNAGQDSSSSEGITQGEENFFVGNVSPEDRALLEHIFYFMANKKLPR